MQQAGLAEQRKQQEQHTALFVEGFGWAEPALQQGNGRPQATATPAAAAAPASRRLSTSRPTSALDVEAHTAGSAVATNLRKELMFGLFAAMHDVLQHAASQ